MIVYLHAFLLGHITLISVGHQHVNFGRYSLVNRIRTRLASSSANERCHPYSLRATSSNSKLHHHHSIFSRHHPSHVHEDLKNTDDSLEKGLSACEASEAHSGSYKKTPSTSLSCMASPPLSIILDSPIFTCCSWPVMLLFTESQRLVCHNVNCQGSFRKVCVHITNIVWLSTMIVTRVPCCTQYPLIRVCITEQEVTYPSPQYILLRAIR